MLELFTRQKQQRLEPYVKANKHIVSHSVSIIVLCIVIFGLLMTVNAGGNINPSEKNPSGGLYIIISIVSFVAMIVYLVLAFWAYTVLHPPPIEQAKTDQVEEEPAKAE